MLVVGVSGATCSGKTTICNILRRLFVNSRVFNQDDYYWEEDSQKHIRDEKEIINWEILSGFDMNSMYNDISSHLNNAQEKDSENKKFISPTSTIYKVEDVFGSTDSLHPNQDPGDSLHPNLDPASFQHINLVLVEGILVLNDSRISDLCDHKFFLELDYDTCWERRQHRTYDPQDQEGYFKRYAWPYYLSNKKEMECLGRPVTYLNGKKSIQENFCDILNVICSSKNS